MPNGKAIDPNEYLKAKRLLGLFIEAEANAAAERVGFDWTACAVAPNTFDALNEAFDVSRRTAEPLPVSSLHCEKTIYGSAETNHLLRFWHDVSHVLTGLTFSDHDEIQLAYVHLDEMRRAGFTTDSLSYKLLYADLKGQTKCRMYLGHFPEDQMIFDLYAVVFGVPAAIEREARLRESMLKGVIA